MDARILWCTISVVLLIVGLIAIFIGKIGLEHDERAIRALNKDRIEEIKEKQRAKEEKFMADSYLRAHALYEIERIKPRYCVEFTTINNCLYQGKPKEPVIGEAPYYPSEDWSNPTSSKDEAVKEMIGAIGIGYYVTHDGIVFPLHAILKVEVRLFEKSGD